MTDHKTRLTTLADHGYTCEHPDKYHWPNRVKGGTCKSVFCERVGAEPHAVYLAVADGLVMPLGWSEDYAFDDFLVGLQTGFTKPVKALPGQRSLFEEDAE